MAPLYRIMLLTAVLLTAAGPSSAQAFRNATLNGDDPRRSGYEWEMTLTRGRCDSRSYGDGRGESDCSNGNVRSQIHGPDVRSGSTVEYAFDILVPADFTYRESLPYRPRGSIEVAGWQHTRGIKNHLYEMHLTSLRGVTFEDRVCFGPNRFGVWNEVRVQIRWTLENSGILQVLCNGTPVYVRQGQTLIPPGCGTEAKTNCRPEMLEHGAPIRFTLGPWYRGFGSDFRDYGRDSPFLPWPPNGISIRVRNPYQGPIRPL